MVGHFLTGIDSEEMIDTRKLCNTLNNLISLSPITGAWRDPWWDKLPQNFSMVVSGSRDNFAHSYFNNTGLVPCAHAETSVMGFNVALGV